MNLGEKIFRLRSEKNMSQGDLAEKLNVSRQSVSKWENGASVPDLDKLVSLSKLFGITIDELVNDDFSPILDAQEIALNQEIGEATAPKEQSQSNIQKIKGIMLIAVGLLCGVLGVLFGWVLLIPAAYLALCGILCMVIKKHAGITIGWLTLIPLFIIMKKAMGISPSAIFNPILYELEMYVQLAVAYAFWAFLIFMVFATVHKTFLQKQAFLIVGWCVFWFQKRMALVPLGFLEYNGNIYLAIGWLTLILLCILLFFTARFILKLRSHGGIKQK